MFSRLSLAQGILALLALVPVACSSAHGDQEQSTLFPFELTAEETRLARDLAEHDLLAPEQAPSLGKFFYIKTELLPADQADSAQRKVMVTHYRYQGDETIHTFVDLNKAETYRAEKQAHYPTGLAPEEASRAEELARADASLADLFRTHAAGLKVLPVPYEVGSADPRFGHRNVALVLQVGRDYLANPRVTVDLTTETVHVTTPQR